jgi:hypothetical protein
LSPAALLFVASSVTYDEGEIGSSPDGTPAVKYIIRAQPGCFTALCFQERKANRELAPLILKGAAGAVLTLDEVAWIVESELACFGRIAVTLVVLQPSPQYPQPITKPGVFTA